MTFRRALLGVAVAALAVISLAAFASFIEFFAYPVDAFLTGVVSFIRIAPWLIPTAIGVAWLLPRFAESGSSLAVAVRCAVLAIPVAMCAFVGQFALETVAPTPRDFFVIMNGVVVNERSAVHGATGIAVAALLYSPFWLVGAGLFLSARSDARRKPA